MVTLLETPPPCDPPNFRAHPAVGIEPYDRRQPSLFGKVRPPFRWMRLPPSEQKRRSLLFYQALFRELATTPGLEVRATFADDRVARAAASAAGGLSVDGRTVNGATYGTALATLADRRWEELTITSASRPVLAGYSTELEVSLWLDDHRAREIEDAVSPAIAGMSTSASPRRTRWAAALILMNYMTLVAVVLAGGLIYRTAERSTPTVVALMITVVLALPLLWPLHAVGNSIQRRCYDHLE
jgi:hypothetical protein